MGDNTLTKELIVSYRSLKRAVNPKFGRVMFKYLGKSEFNPERERVTQRWARDHMHLLINPFASIKGSGPSILLVKEELGSYLRNIGYHLKLTVSGMKLEEQDGPPQLAKPLFVEQFSFRILDELTQTEIWSTTDTVHVCCLVMLNICSLVPENTKQVN